MIRRAPRSEMAAGGASGAEGLDSRLGMRLVSLVGGLCVVGALASCGTSVSITTAPAPRAHSVQVGHGVTVTAQAGGWQETVVVHSITRNVQGIGQFGSSPEFGEFLVVDASITDRTGSVLAGPASFSYQAQDGTVYTFSGGHSMTAGIEPQMQTIALHPGQTDRGLVVLDVPVGHGKLILSDPLNQIVATWPV